MTQDKTQAEIPFAVLEYTATFKHPIFGAWAVPVATVDAVLAALGHLGFSIQGVETKIQTERINDYTMIFRRDPPGVTFSVGMSKLVITAENLDWSDVEQFFAGMSAGIDAVFATAAECQLPGRPAVKPEIQSHQVGIGMHIQIKTRPLKDVTARLLSATAFNLLDGEVKFPGIILQREKANILIDASASYANGIFVRIYRQHPAEARLPQMVETLHKDEERLFEVLGLEGNL